MMSNLTAMPFHFLKKGREYTMVRITDAHDVVMDEVRYYEFAGLSSDSKPLNGGTIKVTRDGQIVTRTIAVCTGSLFVEVDTGDVYAFDESGTQWRKLAALGGAGE